MTNPTRRRAALLGALLLLGITAAVSHAGQPAAVATVEAGDTASSPVPATTTTTAVPRPITTLATVPTTTIPYPTTVATTVEPTTAAPPTEPPTTEPPARAPPLTEAVLAPATEIPDSVTPDPAAPVAVRVEHGCDAATEALCTQPAPPPLEPWAYCEQWHQMAHEIGWPESQSRVLSYVMHRESGCNPNAYNRSGATGLMQLLGWSCPPNGCRDPWSNLTKALDLWQSSGWCPWVLRGDPVTGRACG